MDDAKEVNLDLKDQFKKAIVSRQGFVFKVRSLPLICVKNHYWVNLKLSSYFKFKTKLKPLVLFGLVYNEKIGSFDYLQTKMNSCFTSLDYIIIQNGIEFDFLIQILNKEKFNIMNEDHILTTDVLLDNGFEFNFGFLFIQEHSSCLLEGDRMFFDVFSITKSNKFDKLGFVLLNRFIHNYNGTIKHMSRLIKDHQIYLIIKLVNYFNSIK
jgi:hypothetical protein